MPAPFPFSAIVGQDEMKLAVLVAAVEPAIGGVLVLGDRGTGKSTAVRALAAFDAHTGALQPHFAYGALSKPQYLRAHLMHLAHHWTEVVRI